MLIPDDRPAHKDPKIILLLGRDCSRSEAPGVQRVIAEVFVDRTMKVIGPGLGNGVDHGTEISSIVSPTSLRVAPMLASISALERFGCGEE